MIDLKNSELFVIYHALLEQANKLSSSQEKELYYEIMHKCILESENYYINNKSLSEIDVT